MSTVDTLLCRAKIQCEHAKLYQTQKIKQAFR